MIEAQTLSERSASLNALLATRKSYQLRAAIVPPEPVVAETPAPSGLAADLRFFAICYLAGLIFFLIMLT